MRPFYTLFLILLLALPAGCGASAGDSAEAARGLRPAAAPYNENALNNLFIGRTYLAQGRYALAKEHFLIGLASAEDPEVRAQLRHEVQAADMMITIQR